MIHQGKDVAKYSISQWNIHHSNTLEFAFSYFTIAFIYAVPNSLLVPSLAPSTQCISFPIFFAKYNSSISWAPKHWGLRFFCCTKFLPNTILPSAEPKIFGIRFCCCTIFPSAFKYLHPFSAKLLYLGSFTHTHTHAHTHTRTRTQLVIKNTKFSLSSDWPSYYHQITFILLHFSHTCK